MFYMSYIWLFSRRAEAAGATVGIVKRVSFLDLWLDDRREDELRDLVALRDGKLLVAEVREYDADLSAIARVYRAWRV